MFNWNILDSLDEANSVDFLVAIGAVGFLHQLSCNRISTKHCLSNNFLENLAPEFFVLTHDVVEYFSKIIDW